MDTLFGWLLASAVVGRENEDTMRILLGIMLTLAMGLGMYYIFLRHASSAAGGMAPTQLISTTGVQMDLDSIAQAERSYIALNGAYATRDQLISSGILTMSRTGRDGYTYSVEVTTEGFTATAKWAPQTGAQSSLHYPIFAVDQGMTVHQVQ
jgi:hypothetical protein